MKLNEKYNKSFYIPLPLINLFSIIKAVDFETEDIIAGIILEVIKKDLLN